MVETRRQRVLLGLIGAPIAHSASPRMHEAAAEALGMRAHYQLVEVAGAGPDLLRTLLAGLRHLGFAGVNVTYPYKEAVMPFLDALSDDARAVGAVNTIVVAEGRLVGHNTDASGFARALLRTFGPAPRGPVALVGAGGVGKAAAVALARLGGIEIRLFDTDAAKARHLAASLDGTAEVRACAGLAEALDGAGGLVNGTPIGMLPDRGSPVPEALLRPDLWVADAVYSPLHTPLLRAAGRLGAPVMTGRELAIHQALDAFRLFTGREPPEAAMAAGFDAALAAQAPH
ncbi:shikimate dehydrogenase [Methylobacterium oryzihabitans]|uniref:Shikimate dehydrogenase (NADP(+)) n=1 Tax=Methylobacterium oryzihabitans TaxID=2499852 RepID=A0A437PAR9_9HYPH|nr:shikimate dehydrogenase [Methylobacterium oryzihabitans]RVU19370.1 shikimate dehydrogenase [Methylobacterium oryzihabitans]